MYVSYSPLSVGHMEDSCKSAALIPNQRRARLIGRREILTKQYVSDHRNGSACWKVGCGGRVYPNLERLDVVQGRSQEILCNLKDLNALLSSIANKTHWCKVLTTTSSERTSSTVQIACAG